MRRPVWLSYLGVDTFDGLPPSDDQMRWIHAETGPRASSGGCKMILESHLALCWLMRLQARLSKIQWKSNAKYLTRCNVVSVWVTSNQRSSKPEHTFNKLSKKTLTIPQLSLGMIVLSVVIILGALESVNSNGVVIFVCICVHFG